MTHERLFSVEGLACGTRLVELLERLHHPDGVVEVAMSLKVGGRPPVLVRSERIIISSATLAGVVTEAGLTARTSGRDMPVDVVATGQRAVVLHTMAGARP